MSIVITKPATPTAAPSRRRVQFPLFGAFLSALLTPIALLILGYHPYAEDGGLYLAGVKYLLNPALFPYLREFVTAPLHYSAFSPSVAFLVSSSGLSFEHVVFILYLGSLWATIFAAWRITKVCFNKPEERMGATLLVTLWMSLPVAGTSLMLVDPYLTARSFSTPLVLFGIAAALKAVSSWQSGSPRAAKWGAAQTAFWLVLAAAFHPLMAGYGATFVLTQFWLETRQSHSKVTRAAMLFAAGVLFAALTQVISPKPSAAITKVDITRSYWFLAQWEWFEIVGLVAPLLLLAAFLRSRQFQGFQSLARTTLTVGLISVAISHSFSRSNSASFGVAHLQPLRVFQVIYFALFLGLGAWLARTLLKHVWWRWIIAIFVLGIPVLLPAWSVFPHSAHIERPQHDSSSSSDSNPWVNAFFWIRRNTPVDAFFAIDAHYISDPLEDAQSFRAIAERSVLPDYSKDGGETAVNSSLSEAWSLGVDTQQNLSSQDDAARYQRLHNLDVTWMVLRSDALTASTCPYNNGTVKVCKLQAPTLSR